MKLMNIFVFAMLVAAVSARMAINDYIIDTVNKQQSAWVAGRNPFFEGWTLDQAKALLGAIQPPKASPGRIFEVNDKLSLPATFDSRERWPGCVGAIRNQGQCGSCWAHGAAESLSDRFCIASNGTIKPTLSVQQLVSCDWEGNHGCNGGIPHLAWDYMEINGLPTDSCFPYVSGDGKVPSCRKTCVDSETRKLYHAKTFSTKFLESAKAIKQAIYEEGPVEGTFEVYEDFMHYTSGIYVHTTGQLLGGHAIKIIGWGTDPKEGEYFIVANSWGPSWGEDGFFRIKFGECGISAGASAGSANL
eukprot:GCRY01000077.1.p1 GENE.GCRY01000077.1~~GCRY01000077.1.p1  ORF type:complete len:303 (+),score=58.21 GCRY01000077.1:142-1050(+)